MVEAFLINAPETLRSTKRKVARKGGGLPSGLLKSMIAKYGRSEGMRRAWAQVKGKSGSGSAAKTVKKVTKRKVRTAGSARKGKLHRPRLYESGGKWYRSPGSAMVKPGTVLNRPKKRKKIKRNPFGEEVLIMANKPKKRRKKSVARATGSKKRKVSRRTNPVAARTVHRKRRHVGKRRHRRNPVAAGGSMMNMYVMPILGAMAGRIVADKAPGYTGLVDPNAQLAVKAVVAFGGSYVIKKFGRQNALAAGWFIGAASDVALAVLNKFTGIAVSAPMLPGGAVAGLRSVGYYPGMSEFVPVATAPRGMGEFVNVTDSEGY